MQQFQKEQIGNRAKNKEQNKARIEIFFVLNFKESIGRKASIGRREKFPLNYHRQLQAPKDL